MGNRNKKYRTEYLTIDKQNDRFTKYYKAQKFIPDNEWDELISSFQSALPTSFRLAGNRQSAQSLNASIISQYVPSLSNITFDGEKIPPPSQLPWYPDGLAWQISVSKKVLRKQPQFKKFHTFLVYETEDGAISRQESVSMIPPLFLCVEPHHKVLDMCAAPGSKTAQLLEALHAQDSETNPVLPSGIVVANDSDAKRTHMLIHQAGRLPSPCFLVTNLDASSYPSIKVPPSVNGQLGKRLQPLLFDRILCDVPCSGDGTLRKNVAIWNTWQPGDGNGLHSLQLRILQRAMRLLAPGGRIVYSTCSLNPIENEAVIAEALNSFPAFHIVDVSDMFPELKRRPGVNTWIPAVNKEADTPFLTYEEYKKSLSPAEEVKSKLSEGHWPPENAESLNLHRCIRVYPQLQDTGGFFVTVLEKMGGSTQTTASSSEPVAKEEPVSMEAASVDAMSVDAVSVDAISTEGDAAIGTKREAEGDVAAPPDSKRIKLSESSPPEEPMKQQQTKSRDPSFKEDPYTYLSLDNPVLGACKSRLHLSNNFPFSNVLVRNPEGSAVRSLYLTNDLAKIILQNNDYTKIRLTGAGTKVFVKQEAGKGHDSQFRILGEGLGVVLPFIDPSFIDSADLTTLKRLLSSYYPLFTSFGDEFQKVIQERQNGCMIIRIPAKELDDLCISNDIVLPLWKSNVSLSLMIDKKSKSAMSLRLFGEDITPSGKEAGKGKNDVTTSDPIATGDSSV